MSQTSNPVRPQVFDETGDLQLLVGKRRVPCKVCSKALARSSPVFKAMLFGQFAEAKSKASNGGWVVELPDDEVNSMLYIFNIIHDHVDRISRDLPGDDEYGETFIRSEPHKRYSLYPCSKMEFLYLLTRAADKYQVLRLFKPWAKDWLAAVREVKMGASGWSCEVLWAAWLLGDEELLRQHLMALSCGPTPTHSCMNTTDAERS
ncbi:hypothetical protein GE09DRAFT_215542 [Coniochaeta sp. 2T2.1]|nr:hypothetical protein GE09DRAFT_215542 [Coniochaeta sp. 2T2.1]